MAIRVELFGVPRMQAGMDQTTVLEACTSATLAEVLHAVGRKCPAFAEACLENGMLRAGILANVDGEKFESNLDAVITDEQTLLLLSADAGG